MRRAITVWNCCELGGGKRSLHSGTSVFGLWKGRRLMVGSRLWLLAISAGSVARR